MQRIAHAIWQTIASTEPQTHAMLCVVGKKHFFCEKENFVCIWQELSPIYTDMQIKKKIGYTAITLFLTVMTILTTITAQKDI